MINARAMVSFRVRVMFMCNARARVRFSAGAKTRACVSVRLGLVIGLGIG